MPDLWLRLAFLWWSLLPGSWVMAEGPSAVTPEQLFREIASLRSLMEARFQAHDEKFRALVDQLEAAEKSRDAYKQLAGVMLQKSEEQAFRQISQIQTILREADANVNEKLLALKERQDRMEGRASGVGMSWGVLIAVTSALLGIGGFVLAMKRRA